MNRVIHPQQQTSRGSLMGELWHTVPAVQRQPEATGPREPVASEFDGDAWAETVPGELAS